MVDWLNYSDSPLNPLLKIIIFVLLGGAATIYFVSRQQFGGETKRYAFLLYWFTAFFALSALFRYFGHGTEFGFNSDYSLKWFESSFLVIGSVIFILAGRKLNTLFDMKKA